MTTAVSRPKPSTRWRVVDIVIAAVLGVAVGLLFFVWNLVYAPVSAPLEAALPGMQALVWGFWLVGGVLGGLVIRKPGAALFVELVAAAVSATLGASWGSLTIEAGLVQGLGAELVFLAFLYSNWRVYVALLAGALAGVAMAINDLVLWYPATDTPFKVIYLVCSILTGAVIAGLGSWAIVRGLAKTGALSRFASGRSSE
jgi:energy-coupling factor transport system permease protein